MKALIKHLLLTNLDEIVSKSRLHCHAKNVHSIMLLNAPGKTIRLFVAMPGNDLNRNLPDLSAGMSVGFHAHHCELTLVGVRGSFMNWTIDVGGGDYLLNEFEYTSCIRSGSPSDECGFVYLGRRHGETRSFRCVGEGDTLSMAAKDIHTIGLFPHQRASVVAWLVFEGREDSAYDGRCWSNSDLTKLDASKLYKPTTQADIYQLLDVAGLL